MKTGLKLWSTNTFYIPEARRLFDQKAFDYLELFTEPGSFDRWCGDWRALTVPFIIHAPHFYTGLNFSKPEQFDKNLALCEEVDRFREALNPAHIIFHPGINGKAGETIRQLNAAMALKPKLHALAVIENKPLVGLKDERCVGASPEELKSIGEGVGLGYCLDFGHATCYAASMKLDIIEVIGSFCALSPRVYHLSDGIVGKVTDSHDHLGKGNLPLEQFVQMIPNHDQAYVTIETNKDSKENLNCFEKDSEYLRRMFWMAEPGDR